MTHSQLKEALDGCSRCKAENKNRLLGESKGEKGIMLVFYSPVEIEGKASLLTVGERVHLMNILSLFDICESNVYMTSLVKCALKTPSVAFEEACLPYLRWQFRLLRPKKVICFGERTAKRLIAPDFALERSHGLAFNKGGTDFYGTYEVSALPVDEGIRGRMLHDLTSAFSSELEVKFE